MIVFYINPNYVSQHNYTSNIITLNTKKIGKTTNEHLSSMKCKKRTMNIF